METPQNTKSALLTNIHNSDAWFSLLVAIVGIGAGVAAFFISLFTIIGNNIYYIPLLLYGILMIIIGIKIITVRDFEKFKEFTQHEAILTLILIVLSVILSYLG